MARGVTVVRHRQLRAAVGQVGHADLFGALLHDVVDAAPRHGRQILAVGIARPILDGAGHPHVALGLREPRRDLGIVHRPVLADAVEVRGLEVDVSEPRRRSSPEIGLAARRLAPLPVPIGARRVRIRDVVLEQVAAFAVFGLFDRVGFLMGLAFEAPADCHSRGISGRKPADDRDSPSRGRCAARS